MDRGRPAAGGHARRPCRGWPRRSGSWPAGWAAAACRPTSCPTARCPDPPATSRTSTPTRNWRPCSPRPTAAATARRSRCGTWSCRCCSARSTPAACAASEARLLRVDDVDIDTGVLQIRDAKGGKDRQVPVCEPLRATARRLPRPGRRAPRRGLVLPRHGRAAADAREHRQELPPVPLAGPHLPRRPGPRPPRPRSTAYLCGQQPAFLVRPAATTSARCCRSCKPTWAIPRSPTPPTTCRLTAESYPDITARVQHAIGDVVPPVTAGPRHGH